MTSTDDDLWLNPPTIRTGPDALGWATAQAYTAAYRRHSAAVETFAPDDPAETRSAMEYPLTYEGRSSIIRE